MDAQTGGADLRIAPGRLAGPVEIAARGGRQCPHAESSGYPRHQSRPQKSKPVKTMTISRRGFLGMTGSGLLLNAQDQRPIFRVKVDMVVHTFQVTDSKNHYVNGLKPSDFRIYEDGILQKVATFAEGANTPVAVNPDGTTRPILDAKKDALPGLDRPDAFVGTNVFVLFDTSNFMYRGFVYAEDAIADFVRGLDHADSVAIYTFSRNLSRAA